MSTGTLILILEGTGVLGAATLVFITGHHRGRRSCRNEYPDGFDCGQAAERQRWEDATGTTWDALARWQSARTPEPDFDPEFPPATLLLADDAAERLAEADAALGKVPSVAEVDSLAAEWDRIHPGWREDARRFESARAPILADITDAARWRPPGHADVPTVDGVVVTPGPAPAADWDVLAGRALPDYAAAAMGGHRTVDELVDSIVMRAVKP